MISEAKVEKALEYMRIEAKALAQAKGERIYLQEFRKTQKAILMQDAMNHPSEQVNKTGITRETYAYAHDDYVKILAGLKEAVIIEEEAHWKMIAAQAFVEVWRTQQATNRMIDRSHA